MTALLFVVIGVLARVIPHIPNVTPVGATALFGGTYVSKRWAIIVPLAIMILSDFVIGFDSWISRITVYGCLVLTSLLGLWLRNHKSITNILGVTLLSSSLFFLITNASVWAFGTMYSRDFSGLMTSYAMGLPFFRNTVLGDLFYTGLFFCLYELAQQLGRSVWLLRKAA